MKFLASIKMDLHIHSRYSFDSKLSIEDIINYYNSQGFEAISITDHDSFYGSMIARRICIEKGFDLKIILGAEIETVHGEVILLTSEEPPRRIPKNLFEILDLANDENGLVIAPHPYAPMRMGLKDKIFEEAGKIDVIEVWNGRVSREYNDMAFKAAEKLGKPGIANSDAHSVIDLGSSYTIIDTNGMEIAEIFSALKKNRIVKRVIK